MKNYWKYKLMLPFLEVGVADCTFVELEGVDLKAILATIIKMAIEDFSFPKIPLTYEYDRQIDSLDNEPFGYYFTEDVTQAELKVLFAWMKVYWVQLQLNNKENFINPLFDSSIKGYSPAMMLKTIKEVFEITKKDARDTTFNYSKKNKQGRPSLGDINENTK